MSADDLGQAVPDVGAASPRLPMLAVVDRLTAIAGDVRVDAGAAGDVEQREYLRGEHRGLMEATEVLLDHDWAAAWREACRISSVVQLDALPAGSVVVSPGFRDDDGDAVGAGSWTKCDERHGHRDGRWFWWAMDYAEPSTAVALPALLVWHPGWEA